MTVHSCQNIDKKEGELKSPQYIKCQQYATKILSGVKLHSDKCPLLSSSTDVIIRFWILVTWCMYMCVYVESKEGVMCM
jgi:hypothetical protein